MSSKNDKGAKHFVHVFVYGSLKKGLGNHTLMQRINAEFIGYDTVCGALSMVSYGGFPAVCHNEKVEGYNTVYGQLYRIPPEGLDSLDALEGHPRWYKREKRVTDYLEKRAWIYMMPQTEMEGRELVTNNMWRVQPDEAEFWTKKGEDVAA